MSTIEVLTQKLAPHAGFLGGLVVAAILGLVIFFQEKDRKVLDPVEWRSFKLVDKDHLSHNTALYRFALPRASDSLGLPIGQHISVAAEINGKQVVRSYTPTTLDDDKGHFDLVVKTYEKGNISRYLSLLTIGQEVKVKGPKGKFVYTYVYPLLLGVFTLNTIRSPNMAPHLVMIAGGTGITPMYQIIKSSVKNPRDQTKLSLIYANVQEDDILLKKEIDELQAKSNGRFDVKYVLNNPPEGWTGGVGFVTKEMIEEAMPPSGVGSPNHGEGHKVLMCGPPPMINAMKGHLAQIGYPAPRSVSKLEDQVFLF
ncbi:NADH-cytochrome b5 reductase 1 [Cryptococcus deuterogattii R265]|uniref:NADH-cytochrome b5 reductase 1 n=1 Tax=Cryptococcus deuterogattii (strain R265) TaxID=294750 RepID=UPI0019388DF2|nr:NADH-cytochrome b5 reductase 1 [Cryptococcus deuterogattii R265]